MIQSLRRGSPRHIFLLALLARLGAAVVTERRPIFPAYFDADATEHHRVAARMVLDWREGRPAAPTLSPAKRVYDYGLAALYRLAGPRPLCARALNAVFAALAVLLLHRLALLFLPPPDAARFAAFLALWPSYVYFGGGNTKDPLVFLLIAGAVFAYASYLRAGKASQLVGSAVLLVAVGLLKTHFVLALAAGLSLPTAVLAASASRERRMRLLAALGVAVAAGILYRPVARALLERWLVAPEGMRAHAQEELELVMRTHPPPLARRATARAGDERPTIPRRIEEFRDSRHYWSQYHAQRTQGRRVETQILPGARFDGWLDLLLFIPKGAFHALFMPLPGLYPLEGKLGRWLGAAENLGLLALFAAAIWRLAGRGWPDDALVPAGLFLVLAAASGLFEFDLGSAARHKPEYLPFILLFAFKGTAVASPQTRQGAVTAPGAI